MNLQRLEERALEVERSIHELLREIRRMKQAQSDQSIETGRSKQIEIARRMRAARDAMLPLDATVKDLVEEGRER